jgi:hypothetical protein
VHQSVNQFVFTVFKCIVHDVSFSLLNALDNHLLCRLGGNAPVLDRSDINFDLVADLGVLLVLFGFSKGYLNILNFDFFNHILDQYDLDCVGFVIYFDLDVLVAGTVILAVCGPDRGLDRIKYLVAWDTFLIAELVDCG